MNIVVLLPVFRPRLDWLKDQLDSVANQTRVDFTCVVSYDGKIPDEDGRLLRYILPDDRFVLVDRAQHLGTYHHIELLVREYGLQSEYFALCDQDDIWSHDRLELQLSHFDDPRVSAVSVNGQIVDSLGVSLGGWTTFEWFGISSDNLNYRFVLNQVTGASMICRSSNMRHCVPFPNNRGTAVHDHWLYIAAVANGNVVFDGRPLWMYRQHDGNQIGAAVQKSTALRMMKGFGKAAGIVIYRLRGNADPVILQGLEFARASNERWPQSGHIPDLLSSKLSVAKRLQLLRPRVLVKSRVESLRLAISRSSMDAVDSI